MRRLIKNNLEIGILISNFFPRYYNYNYAELIPRNFLQYSLQIRDSVAINEFLQCSCKFLYMLLLYLSIYIWKLIIITIEFTYMYKLISEQIFSNTSIPTIIGIFVTIATSYLDWSISFVSVLSTEQRKIERRLLTYWFEQTRFIFNQVYF